MAYGKISVGVGIRYASAVALAILSAACSEPAPHAAKMPQTKFYLLRGRQLWGDYGHVLIHGFAGPREEQDGILELERTGPFIPPITLPWPANQNLIVTDDFRKQLETAEELGRLHFRRVIKKRIVELPWHQWDLRADDPEEYPESGEPDDYLLDRSHSPAIAATIGELWQVILNDGGEIDTDVQRTPWDYDVRVHIDTWNGDPIFWGKHPEADPDLGRWIIVTDRAKRWLEEKAGEWVRFQELPVK